MASSTPPKTPLAPDPQQASLVVPAVATLIAFIVAVAILKIPALITPWSQAYDPTGHWSLSTLIASLPVVVLLASLAVGHLKAHYAALAGLELILHLAAANGQHRQAGQRHRLVGRHGGQFLVQGRGHAAGARHQQHAHQCLHFSFHVGPVVYAMIARIL